MSAVERCTSYRHHSASQRGTAVNGWLPLREIAYFHTPDELAGEVAAAGFEVDGPMAVWPVHANLLGASPHLLITGRRPR